MNHEKINRQIANTVKSDVAASVLSEFSAFCQIPHGSKNEAAIVEYLSQRLMERGFCPYTDAVGNLICDIPASKGCENSPLTVLQGHVDMVCAVKDDSYSPERDPIIFEFASEEKTGRLLLQSDGRSSLGADCGLGNAVLLWVLLENRRSHGPLRLIFTVEEELGLMGAKKMDASLFDDVKYVINVDGFRWGRLTAGSAGGSRETYTKKAKIRKFSETPLAREECYAVELCLKGFRGGHSGFDIDKGRANAIKLLNCVLTDLDDLNVKYCLSAYNGGLSHNVIPGEAMAVIVFQKKDLPAFQKTVSHLMDDILRKYCGTDPEGLPHYHEIAIPEYVLADDDLDSFVTFVDSIKNGVLHYMKELSGVVDVSSNLGMVHFCAESGTYPECEISVMSFARSMTPEYHDEILASHKRDALHFGFCDEVEEYRTWCFDRENQLLGIMKAEYLSLTGQEPEITAVHVGLEPSVFGEKKQGLQMISVGPDIMDAHSIHERVHVDTIEPLAYLIAGTLEKISNCST